MPAPMQAPCTSAVTRPEHRASHAPADRATLTACTVAGSGAEQLGEVAAAAEGGSASREPHVGNGGIRHDHTQASISASRMAALNALRTCGAIEPDVEARTRPLEEEWRRTLDRDGLVGTSGEPPGKQGPACSIE